MNSKLLIAIALLTSFFTICTSMSLRGENKDGVNKQTFGNFGPKVKKSFVLNPAPVALLNNKITPVEIAVQFFCTSTSTSVDSVVVSNSHRSEHNDVTHVYLQQVIDGFRVSNGVANVNVDRLGHVISCGNAFYAAAGVHKKVEPSLIRAKLSASEAVQSFARFLQIEDTDVAALTEDVSSHNGSSSVLVSGASFASKDIPAHLKYMQMDNGAALNLVWDLEMVVKDNRYNAFVDANDGKVVSLSNWVSHASYRVFPLGTNDPEDGDRMDLKYAANPISSPHGWHALGPHGPQFTDTRGNNVWAQENLNADDDLSNKHRPDGTAALIFDFPLNLALDPSQYLNSSINNLFYLINALHDLLYLYGFNERSGNFQADNHGLGGVKGDPVIAWAQDGHGFNNANFATPPDGQPGIMRMFVWNLTSPRRDGDFDSGIVIHEYCHGLSNRLTGGSANVNCLVDGEPGGMGEGWSDFIPTSLRVKSSTTRTQDYGIAIYAAGFPIRKFLYSTNLTTNPSTYAFLTRSDYKKVHAIGEVWAAMLYEVFWNLMDKHGFGPDWNKPSSGGNTIMLQLIVDGLKLQPCNPSFIDARNAILQADTINNSGRNQCEIWAGFAKRGLGVRAGPGGVEDFSVPEHCQLPPSTHKCK